MLKKKITLTITGHIDGEGSYHLKRALNSIIDSFGTVEYFVVNMLESDIGDEEEPSND